MKLAWACCLCLLCAGDLAAQVAPEGPAPPGVSILKHARSMERWPRPGRPRRVHVYRLKLKYTGAKKIEGVFWDYVFVRPADEKELARVRLRSRAKVGADGDADLEAWSFEPPRFPRVVSVEDVKNEDGRPALERVEIRCLLYADGTWWRQPGPAGDACQAAGNDKKRGDR